MYRSPAPEVHFAFFAQTLRHGSLTVIVAFGAWSFAVLTGLPFTLLIVGQAHATSQSVWIVNCELGYSARTAHDAAWTTSGRRDDFRHDGWTKFTAHMRYGTSEVLGILPPTTAKEFAEALKGWDVRVV